MAYLRLAAGGAAVLVFLGANGRARADCYVDSQNGNDSRSGQSEAEALQSQTAIPNSCTTIRYKRGSVFNQALTIVSSARTYTNYGSASDPLPQFVVSHTSGSGSVVSAYQGGLTLDGLHLAGSHGDGTMANLIKGVCVMVGPNTKLLNSEITNCDIGIMLSGTGSLVQGNYVHDLTMAVDGDTSVDPNSVGGAEGIFINGSNNEVCYNSFVNCTSTAQWTGGSCDGGATEVAVGSGATVSGVKVHHNFSYNNCGFFEVSSMSGSKGTFADSEFAYNVHVDGGWLMLLQVNNTDFSNIKWENNTVVQHKGSTNAGMLTTIFTGTSSGVSGGDLATGTVFLTNNLIILDGVTAFGNVIHANISQTTNLIVDTSKQDPGVVNLKGNAAADFDLTSGSPAVNTGTNISGLTLDFSNRGVPDTSGKTDVGAFEYGATGGGGAAPIPPTAGPSSSGGQPTASVQGGASASPQGLGLGTETDSGCGCRTVKGAMGPRYGFAAWVGVVTSMWLLRRRRTARHA